METIIKPRNDQSEDGDGVRPLTEASTGSKKSKKGPPLKTLAYARMELVLIGEEENINKFKQSKFESLKIGAMQGSWAHMLLQKININPRTANRTEQSLISAVNKGNVDVAFVSAAHYDWFKFQNDNSKIKFTKDFNLGEDLDFNVGMILRNSDQILLDKVNIFIKENLRKNSIKYIFNKYGVRYVLPNS